MERNYAPPSGKVSNANTAARVNAKAARRAQLRYVSDREPGIRRVRKGSSFRYLSPTGKPIKSAKTLARIGALVIPPAWTDVWICTHPRGHLQVVGRDARGRKQSRYHAEWREVRDRTKFTNLIAFGKTLPRIRRRLNRDLKQQKSQRLQVLATVVRLLDVTGFRVGNPEYARSNHSFGLTTLRDRHVDVRGPHLRFRFVGKSGVEHEVEFDDKRLGRLVKRCQDIPGQELFQYRDERGHRKKIRSTDVNEYLQEIAGREFTAKDFRTWRGSVLAAKLLADAALLPSKSAGKRALIGVIKQVAVELGNTPAVCKACYIHPALLEGVGEGNSRWGSSLHSRSSQRSAKKYRGLLDSEIALLKILERSASTNSKAA